MTDLTSYVEGHLERLANREARLGARRDLILGALRRLGPRIAGEFGLAGLFLFGSWAWGRPHERSDIDLAVEGLAPERACRASAALERTMVEALGDECTEVDVHRLEDLAGWVRARIDREGIALHAEP